MSYENFVQCQLVLPLAAAATSITLVAAVAPYRLPPTGGGFLILADSPNRPSVVEVISYTSRAGLVLSGVVRGLDGTTARLWSGAASCYQTLLAGDFQTKIDSKINTADIIDALNSTAADKPLSAAQGKALSELIADRYTKTEDNARFVQKTDVILVAQGGTGKATPLLESSKSHITGLLMKWVSANTISVSSGRAYIPSTGGIMEVPNVITTGALTLTASTHYHVYLYDNAGTPAIEVLTTAPVAYYGDAKNKTGDTTRRYIGSILSGAANVILKFTNLKEGVIRYHGSITDIPWGLYAGASLTPVTVSCAIIVPVTGTHLIANILNPGASAIAILGNPDVLGAMTTSNYSSHVYVQCQIMDELELSSTLTFQCRHTVANNANLYVYGYGYRFTR